MTANSYRPSNGTEGEGFMARFCANCRRDQDEDEPCTIATWAMAVDADDPDYPTEWIVDESGPRCTAFDPVDTDAPTIITDPRQMDLLP